MTVDWDSDDFVFLSTPSPTNHIAGFEVPTISNLSADEEKYQEVYKLFQKGWKHPDKPLPFVHQIYETTPPESSMSSYIQYRDSVQFQRHKKGNSSKGLEQLLFHGTRRICGYYNKDDATISPCHTPNCSLCCILRDSLQISRCGTRHNFRRFGDGIYTTSCSSKADDYVVSPKNSKLRALLVTRVVVGKPYKIRNTATDILEPPCGHHSVVGIPGVDLNYEETVVYLDEAIRPAYLIVYSDNPPPTSQRQPSLNIGKLTAEQARLLSRIVKSQF